MSTPARLVLIASLSLFATAFVSAKTLIHAGALIDGLSDTVRKNVTVVVSGERIEAVQDGFTAPAVGDTVIDLQSATREGARLLGVEQDLGTVEAGKFADLVAVPGDPLADIKLMTKVSFVMKAGTVYKQ